MEKEKDITIYDLANELNISIATVSRALKDDPVVSKKTRKKIFELAEKRGYRSNHFARNLRIQKTNTIGVIVSKLTSYFQASAISGIEKIANSEGYNLIISQSSETSKKEAASARTMFDSRVDGLLVSLAFDTNTLEHFDQFFSKKVPVIFYDRVIEHASSTCVIIDNVKAAYEATKHLIEQGCKRIVHITAPPQQNVYTDRLRGYRQALADYNLAFSEEDVIIGNLSMEAGVEAANTILSMEPKPDGIFVANDNCAAGCMMALKQKGVLIPQDIAFCGFNNDPVSRVIEPNLTTVSYSGFEIGQVAAQQLINHLRGMSTIHSTNTIILRSELIIRESSLKRGWSRTLKGS
jgi:LacI family transcriptional regulator